MDFTAIRDEDEQDDALERRPGCLRGAFKGLALLLLVGLLGVALLPTLMSTDGARKWAFAKINAVVAPARVSCEAWSLGWVAPPVLNKVVFTDASRGVEVKVEQVAFDRGLFRLLPVGVLNLGGVTLKRPDVSVSTEPRPAASPAGTPAGQASGKGFFFLPIVDVGGILSIEDGRVTVTGPAPQPFVAEQVEGSVKLSSYKKPIDVQTQMRVGGGKLALQGKVQSLKELFKGADFEQPEQVTLTLVSVDLTSFAPLVQLAVGEPWIHSGVAEGALTLVVKGKDRFTLEGGLLVNGLSLAGAGQTRSPKGDVALMADVRYDKREIQIAKFELSSPWLRAEADGTLKAGAKAGVLTGAVQAKVTAYLAAVARDFASVLGLSKGFKVQKGELRATLSLAGSEQAMRVDASVAASDLAMTIDGGPLVMKPEPSLVFKAAFPYGGWPEVETFHLKAPFADVYGSGTFDAATVKGKLDLTRFSRDFKRMLKDCPPMVGSAYLDVMTKREDGGVALTSFLKLSDVAAEFSPGQRTVIPQGTVKLAGRVPLKEGKPESELLDVSFDAALDNGTVKGAWKRFAPARGGRELVLRGFTATADFELGSVRRLLGGFVPATAQRRMTTWQGHVVANATAEAAGGVVKARMNAAGQKIVAAGSNGVWRVPDVRLEGALTQDGAKEGLRVEATASGSGALERDGQTVFAERDAGVSLDARVAPGGEVVELAKLKVSSGLFELDASGRVTELATRCLVSAKGRAAVDFAAVMRLLEAEGIDEFELAGRELRDFRFESPLTGGAGTVLSEGNFEGAAFLSSFKGLGLQAGPADVSVRLAKGALKLAYEPALNGGKLKLVPEAEVGGKMSVVSLPPRTRLLENVALTQGMVDSLLVNMNPLFQGSQVRGGSVTLDVRSMRLAAEPAPAKRVLLDADILFKQLKLELGPSLLELLAMVKVKERTLAVDQLPVHVVVRDGRVHVDPVRVVIDRQPLIFSGWVAFDGSVKYLVEVPVTERLAGGTAGKLLKGTVIKIPVSGTVTEPRLDASALRNTLGSLLKSAVGEQAVEKVGTFLDKLQQELQK